MRVAMNILIVDDESNILKILEAYLKHAGFNVFKSLNGGKAIEIFNSNHIDFIILDLMLPDIDGLDLCQEVRKTSSVPIIMLTSRTSEDDIVKGLRLGADDYLVKPFSGKELIARIESVQRRFETLSKRAKIIINNAQLVIIPDNRDVYVNNSLVNLTNTEYAILYELATNPLAVYSRSQLIDKVMDQDFDGYDRVIDSHIKNLRHKIESDPSHPEYIKTVHGIGYKFGYNIL